jgi:quercetin dioxygenase-like cupin family protein
MARAGDVLVNPPMGGRIVFRKSAADTDGELLEFDCFMEPHTKIAKAHLHPRQEERFEVLAGRARGKLGGEEKTVSAGDVVVTPPGVPHVWWNDAEEELHLRVEFRPALDSEAFLETVWGLAKDGKTGRQGIPNPLQMAVLLAEHPDEFYPAGVPLSVLKPLVKLCAPIARLAGYRAHYPRYTRSAQPAAARE